jgi:hypothetical protein
MYNDESGDLLGRTWPSPGESFSSSSWSFTFHFFCNEMQNGFVDWKSTGLSLANCSPEQQDSRSDRCYQLFLGL